MSRLIIVAGASGAGKSFLLENARRLDKTIIPVRKLTTRSPRPYEDTRMQEFLDLHFSQNIDQVTQCDYKYRYGEHWYGVEQTEIDRKLSLGLNPVVIIRNCETILQIKRDYPNALVLYLQCALSGRDLREKLAKQGRADIDIEERMTRLQTDFHDYVRHLRWNIFDHVLVNFFEADSLIEQLQMVLISDLKAQDTVDPNFVFVLMSFRSEMDDIYEVFRAAGELAGRGALRVERVDAQLGDYRITDKVLENIRSAALIVCDLTYERPNVYYELGYARGIGKTVVNCARQGTKLHFDIRDFRTIFYASATQLQRKVTQELAYHFRLLVEPPSTVASHPRSTRPSRDS